jgi:hypothetical protein
VNEDIKEIVIGHIYAIDPNNESPRFDPNGYVPEDSSDIYTVEVLGFYIGAKNKNFVKCRSIQTNEVFGVGESCLVDFMELCYIMHSTPTDEDVAIIHNYELLDRDNVDDYSSLFGMSELVNKIERQEKIRDALINEFKIVNKEAYDIILNDDKS